MRARARPAARLIGLALALALLAPASALGAVGWLPSVSHGNGLDPALAGNAAGVVAFAWVGDDGSVNARVRSPDGVLGPVESVPLMPVPVAQNLNLDLAVDARGVVHLSSALANGRPLEYQQRQPSGAWLAAAEQASADDVRDAQVAAGPDGRAVIAYRRDDGHILFRTRPPGGSWSAAGDLTPTGTGADPGVEVDADGDAVLAWTLHPDATPSDAIPMAARLSTGGTLVTKKLDTGADGADVRVVVDGPGNAVFVWRAADLETNTWPAGGNPDLDGTKLDGALGQSPDVALDGAGGARFVWSEGSPTLAIHTRVRPLGGAFGTAGPLVTEADGLFGPRIALNEAGGGAVVWRRSGSVQTIEGLALPAGGPAAGVQPLSGAGSSSVSDQDVVVDAAGNAFALWRRDPVIETAAFDAVGPSVTKPVVPARAERAVPVTLSAPATDNWSAPVPSWSFGDGTTADGTTVSHAWQAPGTYDVGVRVTDEAGYVASTTGTRSVTVTDSRGPIVRRVRMLRKRFRVGTPRPAPARARRGSAFIFTLSERASVRIALARKKGRRYVRAGAVRSKGARGRNVVTFSGRVKRKALKRGAYRATLVATDQYTNPSRATRLRFRIVR